MDYSYFFKRFYFILIISFIRISVFAADFYVSPSGNDSNSGLIDNPFATIERAKQEVISLIKTDKNTNCIIWLADGLYEIENPVIFDSNDFNGNNKIAIKALLDANPVVSGGIRLQGWKKNEAGIWEMELPKKKKGNWKPRELFIKDKRASRARYPNDNYLRIKKVGDDRRTNFFFEKGDFPIPEKTKGVELVLLHDWSISRISVKEINSDENKLTAVDSIGAKNPAFFNLDYWEKQPRYFLENALEFLDKDFEWVFDSNKNKVYVKLPENKNPEELQIVIPFSEGLVELKGSENHPIKNIYFEGITFQHCAWQIPEMGYCGIQACHFDSRPSANRWSVIPASVIAFWAEDCIIQDCVFQNLGGSGLWLSTGCKNCTVSNSDFTNISGNGI
ncbi:MAG: hypothetical protein HOA90_03405, partial [Prolixibacteraceae bacterium]|nr:hypothetical protein [Prolixibacteraceae bacterium]